MRLPSLLVICLVASEAYAAGHDGQHVDQINRFRDCEACPEMVVIPAGEFLLGTQPGGYEAIEPTGESPAVKVQVLEAFAIGVTEVTRSQFAQFLSQSGYQWAGSCRAWKDGRWTRASGASWLAPGQPTAPRPDHPVNCVSWADTQVYLQWLSEASGYEYALPSEAEWEYAARGGTVAPRWWGWNSFEGVSVSDACEHANVYDIGARANYPFPWPHARCNDGFADVAPVGSFDANPYGLKDIVGNLWEWTADCYTGSYVNRAADSRAWVWEGGCETRSVRGGGWSSRPLHSRASNRSHLPGSYRSSDLGFRVARKLSRSKH